MSNYYLSTKKSNYFCFFFLFVDVLLLTGFAPSLSLSQFFDLLVMGAVLFLDIIIRGTAPITLSLQA